MKRVFSGISPVWQGIAIGALVSVLCGWVYLVVLQEPGSAFYPFAGLAFLGGSLTGGIVAARKAPEHKTGAFFASTGAIFGIVFGLFALTYAVLPQFARTSVQLPAFCDGFDGSLDPPEQLAYDLPGMGTGILLAADPQTAVVATIDSNNPAYSSTVFLVNRSDNRIIRSLPFGNDVISASIDQGTVYIYNDKLGYLLDGQTGGFVRSILLIDNYGGLSETDRPIISRASSGHWYMETSAILSSWNLDGSVKSRPHLTFNGIARGCYISGDTQDVTEL